MIETILKVAATSLLVVGAAEAAKRSPVAGAILASLPLTSLLAMIWLYLDTHDPGRVAAFAYGIFWLILPSLVLLLAFPWLLQRGLSFWPSLSLAIALTVAAYLAMLAILKKFGISI